jgi:hypothetical protein
LRPLRPEILYLNLYLYLKHHERQN